MYAVKVNEKFVKTGEKKDMICYAALMQYKSEIKFYKLPVKIVEVENSKEIKIVSVQDALKV